MWRAIFLALGIVLCIAGAECLVLEKAVLAQTAAEQSATAPPGILAPTMVQSPKEIKPAEWAPWTLLSCGAVIILYSYTLPRRNG